MHNAYTQTRKFLMATYSLTNAEADTIITQGVDFGMTQLVDGNWGVHAVVPKAIFARGRLASPRGEEDRYLVGQGAQARGGVQVQRPAPSSGRLKDPRTRLCRPHRACE